LLAIGYKNRNIINAWSSYVVDGVTFIIPTPLNCFFVHVLEKVTYCIKLLTLTNDQWYSRKKKNIVSKCVLKTILKLDGS